MPITDHRKGPYPTSRAKADHMQALKVLNSKWRALPVAELERYLQRVILIEKRCVPGMNLRRKEPPYIRSVHPRLRRRRIAVAERLHKLGGSINELVFARVLPRRDSWPGIMQLVGKKATNIRKAGSTG